MMQLPDLRAVILERPNESIPETQRRVDDLINGFYADYYHSVCQNVPFRIETSNEGFSIDLVQDGRRQSLGEFLAPGFSFSHTGHLPGSGEEAFQFAVMESECDFDKQKVILTKGATSDPALLPSILHEIGHTSEAVHELPVPARPERGVRFIHSLYRQLLSFRRPEIRRSPLYVSSNFLPHEHREEGHSIIGEMERRAWAEACDSMNELDARGFDVWEAFPGDTFADGADIALYTYEARRLFEMFISDGSSAVEKANPMYLLRRGREGQRPRKQKVPS
ncbi:hypothetical protein EXS65_03545 [Candidatus Peribacteria bacterium]|nr:hypothetical protein [Candidatus Peribacteria bacterium]